MVVAWQPRTTAITVATPSAARGYLAIEMPDRFLLQLCTKDGESMTRPFAQRAGSSG